MAMGKSSGTDKGQITHVILHEIVRFLVDGKAVIRSSLWAENVPCVYNVNYPLGTG